jgi:transcriptional regulator with XRE-family HTH domain
MTLGQLMKAKRISMGMTLQEVADDIGSSKSYIHELENDLSEPGLLTAVKLSVALGITMESMASAVLKKAMGVPAP